MQRLREIWHCILERVVRVGGEAYVDNRVSVVTRAARHLLQVAVGAPTHAIGKDVDLVDLGLDVGTDPRR